MARGWRPWCWREPGRGAAHAACGWDRWPIGVVAGPPPASQAPPRARGILSCSCFPHHPAACSFLPLNALPVADLTSSSQHGFAAALLFYLCCATRSRQLHQQQHTSAALARMLRCCGQRPRQPSPHCCHPGLAAQRRALASRTIMRATSRTCVVVGVKVADCPKMACGLRGVCIQGGKGWGARSTAPRGHHATPPAGACARGLGEWRYGARAPQPQPACPGPSTHLEEGEQLAQLRLHLLPQRVGAAGEHQAGEQTVGRLRMRRWCVFVFVSAGRGERGWSSAPGSAGR